MNILIINSVGAVGSTGKISMGLYDTYKKAGHNPVIAYSRGKQPDGYKSIKIGNRLSVAIHGLKSRIFDMHGFGSKLSTRLFLKKVKEFSPDIVHLHNLHGYYINIEMLFKYLKKENIPALWTLHDCWTFTGHCAYFDMADCSGWKDGCNNCAYKKDYPKSLLFSRSAKNFAKKKALFSSLSKLTIVTPSAWLADVVKKSFLGKFPTIVINNGIDLSVFKPTDSSFRKKYNLENKKIILGVANVWDERKGLDVFVELSKRLDEHFKIVLVGISEKQKANLPDGILGITRTQNQTELAEIYAASDLFVNPTREDNFPTVNIEAIACGTPVITYSTGGSPESIDNTCGDIVEKNDVDALEKKIREVLSTSPYSEESCVLRAKKYEKENCFMKYLELLK